ncbi:hypothetical protein [Oricola indica]|uniref:hypothetical protein n=1 Tax=Oricola indica TaxID=2872591 RepID=UPI001CBF9B45|nr:hypothetical protein [Oricola indica]
MDIYHFQKRLGLLLDFNRRQDRRILQWCEFGKIMAIGRTIALAVIQAAFRLLTALHRGRLVSGQNLMNLTGYFR